MVEGVFSYGLFFCNCMDISLLWVFLSVAVYVG